MPYRGDYIPRGEAEWGYIKPRYGINSISHGWLLDKHFILPKGQVGRISVSVAMG